MTDTEQDPTAVSVEDQLRDVQAKLTTVRGLYSRMLQERVRHDRDVYTAARRAAQDDRIAWADIHFTHIIAGRHALIRGTRQRIPGGVRRCGRDHRRRPGLMAMTEEQRRKAEAWQPVRELTDRLAPYPKTEAEATAKAMARHALVYAQSAYVRMGEMPTGAAGSPESAAWHEAVGKYCEAWQAAALLLALTELVGEDVADETTQSIWADLDDGGSTAERLWEWLTNAGIDPAAITDAVKRAVAAERSAVSP
jgi:hypothetical protein